MLKLSSFFETSQDTCGFEPAMAQVVSLLLMWLKQEASEWWTRCFRAAVTETFTPTLSIFKCCTLKPTTGYWWWWRTVWCHLVVSPGARKCWNQGFSNWLKQHTLFLSCALTDLHSSDSNSRVCLKSCTVSGGGGWRGRGGGSTVPTLPVRLSQRSNHGDGDYVTT